MKFEARQVPEKGTLITDIKSGPNMRRERGEESHLSFPAM